MAGVLPDRIATPRLLLREWTLGDVPALAGAVVASIEHLRPWMPWAAFEPLPDTARTELVEGWERARLAGDDAVYGVFLDGAAIGGCGLHRRRGPAALEIGYWIHVDHVGRGFAGEVAAALTTVAFEQPEIERVEIHHDRANAASRRVPERLGYALVAESPDEITAPGEEGVDVTWSIDRATWQATGEPRVGRGDGRH